MIVIWAEIKVVEEQTHVHPFDVCSGRVASMVTGVLKRDCI